MPPFWVGFSKQRKKPGWRRSSNCVQNAFFQLSPSGRSEKTALGSNFKISVSCHHFGWAFPSSGKSRVHESCPISFKTRFVKFPHRGETKKQPWDRILQFRFHATILGGLFQAAEKAGLTKVLQLRSKRVFSTFPIGAKRKNSLGIEFYNFGFMPPFCVGFSKQRKKPGWRRSSNCVQNAYFQLSPSGRSEKTALGSNFTISVSCHHFVWAFPSSGKSRVDEGPPIALKTRFFTFPHRGEAKKTALGSNFKISVSCHHFGWAFPSSGKSRVHESGPISFKKRFVKFPHRGETKKQPWDRILKFRFHATILCGLFQAAEKAGLTKVVQLRWTTRFFNFPHRGEAKKQPWDRILQFRFHATILCGLFQAAEKAGWRRLSNCVQNAFFQLSRLGRSEKTALGSNFTISVSCHHFGWAFPSSGKSRVDEGPPIAFKTRFFDFPLRGEAKKQPWDRILQFRFHATILCGLFQAAEKAGLTEGPPIAFKTRFFNFPHRGEAKKQPWDRILQFRFHATILCAFPSSGKSRVDESRPIALKTRFLNFPIGGNEKTALGSNFKISVSCHHFGWAFPSSGKSRVDEGRPIAFKTRFVKFPHRGEAKKQPWDRILKFRFHATILGGLFQAAEKAGLTKVVQLRSERVFSTFPIGAKRKNSLGIEF